MATIFGGPVQQVLNAYTLPVVTFAGAGTLTTAQSGYQVLYTGATTAAITLPSPLSGLQFQITTTTAASAGCTVTTPSGIIFANSISSGATRTLSKPNMSISLISDGTNWYAVSFSLGGSGGTAGTLT